VISGENEKRPKSQCMLPGSGPELPLFFFFSVHTVANTQFIGNIPGISRLYPEFLSDVCHIYLQLFCAAFVRVAPHPFDDGGVGHHLSAVLGKQGYNIIFRLGKPDLLFSDKDLPCVIINGEIPHPEFPAGKLAAVGTMLIIPQHHADAGQKFRRAEGLGHIVIGPGIQCQDLVPVIAPGGQHDDGRQGILPDKGKEMHPVHIRESQIQNDHIRLMGGVEDLAKAAGIR